MAIGRILEANGCQSRVRTCSNVSGRKSHGQICDDAHLWRLLGVFVMLWPFQNIWFGHIKQESSRYCEFNY